MRQVASGQGHSVSGWRLGLMSLAMLVILGVTQGAGCGGGGGGGGGGGSGLPGAPGGLTATSGDALVSLVWTAVVGANSYDIKRSTTAGGPYATVAAAVLTRAYTDSGLTNGTTYYYVVVARNAAGTSGNSSQVTSTPTVALTAPGAPTGLTATAGDTTVSLLWNAVAGATTYTIKRGTASGGPYGTTVAAGVTGTTFTDTALTNGTTYYFVVSATNGVGTSANSIQSPATPTAPVVVPSTPTGLAATAGNNQVGLTWNSASGAATYNVKRGTVSGGPYTTLATGLTVFTYLDNTAVNGTTYFYVVTGSNSFGSSANSAQVSATPAVPVSVPAAPTNCAAAGSNGVVNVSWDFVSNAASYTVKRATTSGGPYTNVAAGVTALTYSDNTVVNGTTYFYVVVGVNAAGNSANSNEASATPTAPPAIPAAPTGVTATSANTPSITVSWATVAGATSYTVKRGTTTGGPYVVTVASGINTLTTTDNTVAVNTAYFYVVIAANGSGGSANSAEATATTPPAAATGLTTYNGNGVVQMTWNAVTGATSYTLKRGTTTGGPYSTTVAAGLTSPTYEDSTVTDGTVYYYIVIAVGAGGNSQNSAQATGIPSTLLPAAPTGLTATPNTTPAVVLNWVAVGGATSYNVIRSSISQTTGFTSLATAIVGTTYTDNTAVNNNTYWYSVQAVNGSGTGAFFGPPVQALVPTVAPGLPGLSTTATPDVTITWTAVAGGATYRVKRATVSGGPYTTVGTLASPTVTYTDATVVNGTTYYYIVTSDNGGIESANSPENSILTYPAVPTGLGAVSNNTPQVVLTWTAVTGAATYKVYRGTASGGPYGLTVGTTTAPTVTINDNLALNGTTYYYVVEATNTAGTSALSAEATATVPTAAPTTLAASSTNTPSINLTWTAAAGATGYTIKRGTVTGVYGTTLATGQAGTAYSDATTAVNTAYFYVVIGENAGGNSQNSNEATATTPTAAPTGLAATPSTTPDVALTWTAATGATSYTIKRGTVSGGPYGTTVAAGILVANYTDATVTAGTQYYYVVTAINAGGASQDSTEAGALLPPAAPAGPVATATTTGINLSWTAATGATSYTVKRGTVTGGPYGTTVATGVAGTAYSDTTTAANTQYFYVVVAVNGGGSSVDSGEVNATTPPAAPTGLGVAAGAAQADLNWTGSTGATSYKVYRSLVNGGPYTQIATGILVTSYTDSVVTTGVTYYYVVTAIGTGGESANSNQATGAIPVATPTGVAATSTNDPGVTVSWNAVVGATSYNLKRATVTGGPYSSVDTGLTGLSTTDTSSISGNTQYFYVVSAVSAAGESADSSEVNATTPPDVPGGLGATTDNTLAVALTWSAAPGATSYSVSRSTNSSGPFSVVGTPATNSYNDASASGGGTYYYVVAATGPGGTSKDSGSTTVNMYPTAPGSLSATAGNGQVTLSWPGVGGAIDYKIFKGTSSGTEAYYTNTTSTTYTDNTVTNSTQYFYFVRTGNGVGDSLPSPEANATPNGALPDVPTSLSATPGNATVALNWTAAAGATTYNVYRSTTSGGGYSSMATGVAATIYTDNTVVNGTTYYYVVTGQNVSGEGGASNEISTKPEGVPSAPASLTAVAGDTQVSLSWSTVPSSVYYVYRATVTGGPYTQIVGPFGGTSTTDTGRTNGVTYFYVVTAATVGGESGYSPEAQATPNPGPTVTSTNPTNTMTNVSPGSHYVVNFSLPMNTATTAAATSISPALPYALQMYWSNGNQTMTIVFDTQAPSGIHGNDVLADNTTYTISISTAATSSGGTPMPGAFSAQFTTQTDNTAPSIASYTPDITTTAIPAATSQIDILFDEDMKTSQGGVRLKLDEDNEVQAEIGNPSGGVSVAWLGDNRTLRVTLTSGTLKDATFYQLQTQNCNDANGNFFNENDGQVLITTGNGSDSTPPTIAGAYPLNGATGVSRDTGIVLGFSEVMSPDVLSHITITGAPGVIPVSTLNGQPLVALIGPKTGWPASTLITVTVDTGAQDSSGNGLAAPYVFSFTTAAGSGNAPAFDANYSTIYDGIDHLEPNNFTSDSRLFVLRFKDSVSGARMAVDGQNLAVTDYSLVEKASGLPLKGYQLRWDNSRGLGLALVGSRSITGVNYNTTYTLTLNTTLQNSQGIGLAAPVTFDLTTRVNDANPGRPRIDAPETQYITVQGTPDSHMVEYRIGASNNGPNPLTVKVDFQDLVDVTFAPSVTNTTNQWDVQYKSSGDEPLLTTTGWRQLAYTITDTGATYTQTILEDGYLFDTTNFPTLLGPGTIATSTPTYSWSSAALSGADGLFLSVTNVATDETVLAVFPDLTGTSFTQPSDRPLASGTYKASLILVKFLPTGINGGNLPGQAMTLSLTFTVP